MARVHRDSHLTLNRNLEKAVEELSQMLEEEIQPNTIRSLRRRMVDKTVRMAQS